MFHDTKKILLIVVALLSLEAHSQRFRNGISEIGFFLGGGNYFGDLAPEIVWKETHPAIGILYKYHHTKYYSSRYQFLYTTISGNDQNFKANAYRNLSFQNEIFEIGYTGEFNFIPFGINRNQKESNNTTYIFGGINLFTCNPTAKLPSGDRVELRDIGTEGQKLDGKKKTYALIQPSVNLGVGYKVNLKKRTVIGIEAGFRKTFTDYLDDVSGQYPDHAQLVAKQGEGAGELSQPQTTQGKPVITAGTMRGDNYLRDWYFVIGITITFRNVINDPCPTTR